MRIKPPPIADLTVNFLIHVIKKIQYKHKLNLFDMAWLQAIDRGYILWALPSPSWGTNTHPQLSSLRLLETDVFMWGLQGVPADDMLSWNTENKLYTQLRINALTITLQNKHNKAWLLSIMIKNSEILYSTKLMN